jgi:hypothetical protein
MIAVVVVGLLMTIVIWLGRNRINILDLGLAIGSIFPVFTILAGFLWMLLQINRGDPPSR